MIFIQDCNITYQYSITMTEYVAKSDGSLIFQLVKDSQNIGSLTYKSWFKFNAAIDFADGRSYQVEPKGFWGTIVEVKDGNRALLKFSMNWSGDIVVQSYFNNVEQGYVFRHRGILKESFILIDKDGVELLVLKPLLKWNKMNFEYRITSSDVFETVVENKLLLMLSIHWTNYYMSMTMAAITPGS
ncbi:hypothetical protein [Pollutibacter soli]|uniref:hypothetical protein n=1 Tax=Pollutibacter soli TaxID=3034157 RepID=UPI0030139EAC